MRILWHSNAPWVPTGYGNQTRVFLPRIKGAGHEVMGSCFYGLSGSLQAADGIWFFPSGRDAFGNDMLPADADAIRADIVITLMDAWLLLSGNVKRFRWCPWLPVDHAPLPPVITEILQHAYQPIVFSRFGEKQLREAGLDPLYVPHAVDTASEFYPIPRDDASSKFGGLPDDRFVVGIVAANKGVPSRKCFDQQIRAFANLWRKHDDCLLYLHTDLTSVIGEPLGAIIEMAGLPKEAVAVPNPYEYARGMFNTDYMRIAYNTMDVLLNCARGEGFGIPILEAQACGTPVIVTDFSAMSELCFSGWKVPVDEDDAYFSMGVYQYVPKVSLITEYLEQAYLLSDTERAARRAAARAGALDYDADLVMEQYWTPALDRIAARITAEGDGREPCEEAICLAHA